MFAGSEMNALPGSPELQQAIEKLKSLHDGDRGVPAVTACGPVAVPVLRGLLFEREPSGLYETRRRVVWTLAALKAHDVLLDYLHGHADPSDPVERLGDDAIINAAAIAVAELRSEEVFQLLMRLAQHRLLAGVVQALGTFQRTEAIAIFVEALSVNGVSCRPRKRLGSIPSTCPCRTRTMVVMLVECPSLRGLPASGPRAR
jgi:hypothetical protein